MTIEIKQPKDMGLSELVEKMIDETIFYHEKINRLDGRGSPYASEDKIKDNLVKEYTERIKPYKDELDKREERLYKK